MDESARIQPDEGSEQSSSDPVVPWQKPQLSRVGNLRNLVGKSGPLPDAPGPNPRRP